MDLTNFVEPHGCRAIPEFLRSKAMLAANRRNARTYLDKLDAKRCEKSPEKFSGADHPVCASFGRSRHSLDGAAIPPVPGIRAPNGISRARTLGSMAPVKHSSIRAWHRCLSGALHAAVGFDCFVQVLDPEGRTPRNQNVAGGFQAVV